MIDRQIKEPLDLCSVKINREYAIGARGSDDVCHELRGDRHTTFVFPILPGVAEVGRDNRDTCGGRAAKAVNERQQLHQVVVDRRAGRDDDVAVASANVLFELHEQFAVGEDDRVRCTEFHLEVGAHALGENAARAAREDLEIAVGAVIHRAAPLARVCVAGEGFIAGRLR